MSSSERNLWFCVVLIVVCGWARVAAAQDQTQGFAVERFYPAPPGSGWLVMDDLKMGGRWGGAVSVTTGYSRRPSIISDQAFLDVGVAGTYDRYRVYLNFPMPLVVTGNGGAPSVGIGSNPDTISDPRVGFDVRLYGTSASLLRLGGSAQLIMASGHSSDYVTDGTSRGMFRFLAAGDAGNFSYAGHLGLHIRPLNPISTPGGPDGNEFLFGVAAGRKVPVRNQWEALIGPEFYGETAFHSFLNKHETGFEGLLTGRLERTGDGPNVRLKLGVGHGIVQHFSASQWRVVFGVELFGHRAVRNNSGRLP